MTDQEFIQIQGGRPLSGSVCVQGSKNAILPMLAASLLPESGCSVIRNVPPLNDILVAFELMRHVGAQVDYFPGEKVVCVDATHLTRSDLPESLTCRLRASVLFIPPLLKRLGEVRLPSVGGCPLGSRNLNYHYRGFARLGATITSGDAFVISGEDFNGTSLYLDFPSHTGTENLMMAAGFSKGVSVIENAGADPEIYDFAKFLIKMGATIHGLGTRTLTVEGVTALNPIDYYAMNDRLDAGLFMMAAGIAGGKVSIIGVVPEDLRLLIEKMVQMGVEIRVNGHVLDVESPGRNLKPVNVLTCPYPGFATDFQPAIMALSCIADGQSYIRERIFDKRFSQVAELRKLGADIELVEDDGLAIVNGPTTFRGADTRPDNIRAASCILLAGLACPETTTIGNVYQIGRGHFDIENRFQQIGARVTRKTR
ncbi:UDP-N-acetylglucosamine 1-carboxyvinyltransferase [Desulfosarcina ovata]|uniref:UDP-N-acetylglucosamine 1-carboxyvinyltransferase n=1 Tax=Desulfosarcina ovata subsp. ovata TaxID=2752305 RepID=A0A5K8A9F3_9BACT|nr:UDP-N-acetylglucosamine 1-carboxyvinyltransferase [Desulfosarcina ovata]BBO89109.1 UDP-N-acetylglucosamine 1-carboxyvinyltransferase 1 [Desulfosarcina ovata subsp. ovata]